MRGLRAAPELEPAPTPFNPAELPGLVWLAQADSLSATPVASWSYGAGSLTAAGAAEPAWNSSSSNLGKQPSVVYSSGNVMTAPSTAALQLAGDLTICSVMYVTSVPAGYATVISKGTTSEFDAYVQGGTNPTLARNGNPTGLGAITTIVNRPVIITFTCSGTNWVCYVNGAQVGTTSTGSAATATANAVQVGQRADAGTTLIGEQPFTALCSGALSQAYLLGLHRFLGRKYGIAVQ